MNQPLDGLKVNHSVPSATLAINERSKKLISQGHQVVQFGFGQSPFPVPLEVVLSLQAHADRKEYLPVQGLEELRNAVSKAYKKQQGILFNPEGIIIGPGSKELIFLIQMACSTGLLLPAPSWVSYAPQAQLCGKSVCWINTEEQHHWTLTAKDLAHACKVNPDHRLLILNSPSNPTGSAIPKTAMSELAEVARANKLIVISDEIYGALEFNHQQATFAAWYPEGTIVTGGLSKWCGAGGWRLGTAAFPEELYSILQSVKGMASETFTAVSAPIQYAAVTAYNESPDIQAFLKNSRVILKEIMEYVHRELQACGISMPLASGGFYLFPNFKHYEKSLANIGIASNVALCESILQEAGVALLPGVDFGRPKNELTARLAFVDFNGRLALNWLNQHQAESNWRNELLEACCPKVVNGVERLTTWIKKL